MRYTEIYGAVHQTLNEIMMSPRALKKSVKDIQALAGMEFEMILPNAKQPFDTEAEPDYDMDRDADEISSIEDFFEDGDISRRELSRVIEDLNDRYREWKEEQIYDRWRNNDGKDYFADVVYREEADTAEMQSEAEEEIREENPELDTESQEFKTLVLARERAKLEEFVDDLWSAEGRVYERVRQEFYDEVADEYDESDFLRDIGIRTMQDVQNEYSIPWPYWAESSSEAGDVDIEGYAKDFEKAIGRPVYYSDGYHGAPRKPGAYSVEPDGSLEGDDEDTDFGLEFISPPLPLDELVKDLEKVKKWADYQEAYTNSSTGLHINVSVPDMSTAKLDYVKLAILLGDKRVLNEFGRAANQYTPSALGKIESAIRSNPSVAKEVLDQMKTRLGALATKVIHDGETNKYISINTKGSYVEFRSPGGDWLGANWDLIVPTLNRFVVALDAAMDPQKYRQEYLKKLYKLLAPQGNEDDTLYYFAKYAAGELPQSALKSFVRHVQRGRAAQREYQRAIKSGTAMKFVWEVKLQASTIEVVAQTEQEAKAKAVEEWGMPVRSEVLNRVTARAIAVFDDSGFRGVLWAVVNEVTGDTEAVTAKTWTEAIEFAQDQFPGKFDEENILDIFLVDQGDNVQLAKDNAVFIPPRKPQWDFYTGISQFDYRSVRALNLEDATRIAIARYPDVFGSEHAGRIIKVDFEANGRNSRAKDFWNVRVAFDRYQVENPLQANRPSDELRIYYVSPRDRPGGEIQVRATDQEHAIQRAREIRPDIFGQVHINDIRAALTSAPREVPMQPEQPEVATSDDRSLENTPASGNMMWRIVDRNNDEVHRFLNRAEQASANEYASNWIRNEASSVIRVRAPFYVIPA